MKRKFISSLFLASVIALTSGSTLYTPTVNANSQSYETSAPGKHGDVRVLVTFDNDRIKSVKILSHKETPGISDGAIIKIPSRIVEAQSINVDAISGATFTSSAIINAVKKAIVEAGLDISKYSKKYTENNNHKEDIQTTDVVVIGAGASGTAAALAAKQQGVNVILLEKTATQMGAGTLAGGMFAADSKQQKEKHQQVDKAWLYKKYMEVSGGFMNTLLVRKIIDEAGATVDWLNDNGALMKLTDAGVGGAYEHIGEPATLHGYQEGGSVALKKLLNTYEKSGGKAYFSTPAKELIYDEKGQITGVLAEKEDGTKLKISSKAVIIATGGFGGNAKMLKQYIGTPFTMGEISQNKGDGIKMAWKAGAAERGINVTQYFWAKFSDAEMNKIVPIVGEKWWDLTNFTRYPNLRVNMDGKRFSDETDVTLYSVHGAELHMQPHETEFVIVDSGMLAKIAKSGTAAIESQYGKWKNHPFFYMEFNEPNDTKELLKQENTPYDYTKLLDPLVGKTQTVFKANSLKALAKNMGVNESNFVNSVEKYNDAIDSGKDQEYFSNTSRLIKVSTPPYYAVKFVARNLGTLGGVRINENIQAVDENNQPIKGLYVSGADAGGMYGKAYVDFEGGTLGFAYTSGRLAGINAGQYIKSLK